MSFPQNILTSLKSINRHLTHMSQMNLTYETHRLIIEQNAGEKFTRITNYVEGDVYREMVSSIIHDKEKAFFFVHNERILLNNFLQSLINFHNREKCPLLPPFFAFKDEEEYIAFCIVNDMQFENQIWFKTAFIRTDIYTAYISIQEASVKFLSTLYPQYYHPSRSLMEDWIRKFKEEENKYKCGPNTYKDFLEKNEIEAVYHFTSYKNVDSIKKHGICSIQYLKELGVDVDYVSTSTSQTIDAYKGFADYIHLGFEKRHPMLMNALANGKLASYKIYDINPSVLFLKDTVYSDRNAIKRGVIFSDKIEFLLNIPFHLFHKKNYFHISPEAKEHFQSEILVKHSIPNNLILN